MNYYLMIRHPPPLIAYDEDEWIYFECFQKYNESEELNPLYSIGIRITY